MSLKFEWDAEKAQENIKKHDISFEEAITVFRDTLSITISDKSHSYGEERFIDIGMSEKNRILVVVYTERANAIRIISSRKATKKEIKFYEE
jgi:uncharacterized protein